MKNHKLYLTVMSGLFIGSMSLNVWLLQKEESPKPNIAETKKSALERQTEKAVDCTSIQRELRDCQTEGLRLIEKQFGLLSQKSARKEFDSFKADVQPRRFAPHPSEKGGATAALQQDTLCEIARVHLHSHWQKEKEGITALLRRELPDEKKQKENALREGRELARVAGMEDDSQDAFMEKYTAFRDAHIKDAAVAMETKPHDWKKLFKVAQSLYRAEDGLIEEMVGSEQLKMVRLSQLEKRTAILAMIASYAEVPWTEVTW
jgi:hypothetical protein